MNNWGPGANSVTVTNRQWLLAADPKIVLRQEPMSAGEENDCKQSNTTLWWAVTATVVRKRIGDKEYECAELTDRLDIHNGYVMTTIYVSPDAPTYLVESVKNFYTVDKGKAKFWFTRVMRVMSIKSPLEVRQ